MLNYTWVSSSFVIMYFKVPMTCIFFSMSFFSLYLLIFASLLASIALRLGGPVTRGLSCDGSSGISWKGKDHRNKNQYYQRLHPRRGEVQVFWAPPLMKSFDANKKTRNTFSKLSTLFMDFLFLFPMFSNIHCYFCSNCRIYTCIQGLLFLKSLDPPLLST